MKKRKDATITTLLREKKGEGGLCVKKEKIIVFFKNFADFLITMIILLFIENKLGWMEPDQEMIDTIIDNAIGLTIGLTVWKIIVMLIKKRGNLE